MHKLEYFNYDTEEKIFVKLDENKRSTYIYGGNGMGKTTLSRAIAEQHKDSCFVFNQDFINKNVFVVTSSGTKTDTDTKDGLSDLFLGKEAVDLAKTSEMLKIRLRDSNRLYENMISELINSLATYELTEEELFHKFEEIVDQSKNNDNFDFNKKYNYEDHKEVIIIEKLLPTEVTDKTYEQDYESFKNNLLFKQLQALLNQEEVKYMMSHEGKPNIDISKYNNSLDDIKQYELIFKKDGVHAANYQQWIKQGVYLHEKQQKCLFCDAEDIDEVLKKWKRQLESTTAKIKKQVLDELDQNILALDEIIRLSEPLKDLVPKTLETVNELMKTLNIYKESINNNQALEFKTLEVSKDKSMENYESLREMLVNYELNKKMHQNITLIGYRKAVRAESKRVQNLAIDKTSAEAADIQERLKINLEKLGFHKDIIIKSDIRGNRPKIDLQAKEGEITNFSEGQQHKVALALFFAKIELFKESEKTLNYIVFDDPMRSLDVEAYHRLQRMISDINRRKISHRLLVLTHNLHYLYVQTAYALENKKEYQKVQLFEMRPDTVNEVELSHLRKDDIVLYTMMLHQAEDLNDIGRTYWLTLKIVRSFLDLKMRILGEFNFSQQPSKDLEYICENYELDYKSLNGFYQRITKICRKKDVNVANLQELFDATNHFLEALKFPTMIPENIFELLEGEDQEKKVVINEGTGILENLLFKAHRVSTYDGEDNHLKSMSNYINHPRHQLTSSLFFLNALGDNTSY